MEQRNDAVRINVTATCHYVSQAIMPLTQGNQPRNKLTEAKVTNIFYRDAA
jgi:hypothetical protein